MLKKFISCFTYPKYLLRLLFKVSNRRGTESLSSAGIEGIRQDAKQEEAMSPKLTDDRLTRLELRLKEALNILEKRTLSVQDLKTVFGVQRELLSLKKIEFPDELRRDRDKVEEAMHTVMLRWYEKVCKYYSEKRYDRVIVLYENVFSLHFPEPEGPTDLVWALNAYRVSGETEGIFLMLAEAYLRKKVRSLFECRHFLSFVLQYDEDRETPPPKKAFELLTEVYDAEGETETAILLVEKWIEVCDSKALLDRSWVELREHLKKLELRLEKPVDTADVADNGGHFAMDKADNYLADVNLDAYLSPADLADRFDVPLAALRKRLERWRKKNLGGRWKEVTDRKPQEDRYLYWVRNILSIIKSLKAKASG